MQTSSDRYHHKATQVRVDVACTSTQKNDSPPSPPPQSRCILTQRNGPPRHPRPPTANKLIGETKPLPPRILKGVLSLFKKDKNKDKKKEEIEIIVHKKSSQIMCNDAVVTECVPSNCMPDPQPSPLPPAVSSSSTPLVSFTSTSSSITSMPLALHIPSHKKTPQTTKDYKF